MNSDWIQWLIGAFAQMSAWETTAALLGVGYIILAARESQWCWPMAFISTLIYTILFWDGQLPMQAILNFYYMGMAVYGFLLWRHHQQAEQDLPISSWAGYKQMLFLGLGIILSIVTGYYLQTTQSSQNPYLDASVTIFSVMNTWLMARKVLQNWLYWIVIDAAALVLYWQTGFYATVILFAIYTILAVVGFVNWRKLYRQQVSS